MSCACEHKKLGGDLERIRGLAKAFAIMEHTTVALVKNPDGTYGFCVANEATPNSIIEYISEY